jgi:hypothetical protein
VLEEDPDLCGVGKAGVLGRAGGDNGEELGVGEEAGGGEVFPHELGVAFGGQDFTVEQKGYVGKIGGPLGVAPLQFVQQAFDAAFALRDRHAGTADEQEQQDCENAGSSE